MTYPVRTDRKTPPQLNKLRESAEALTGTGNSPPAMKAITRADAGALGAVKLKSAHVTAAPTATDFNALVDDLRALATLLNTMGATFTGL